MMHHTLLQDCENFIRAGHIGQAVHILKSLNSAKIPRELKLPFANLCRRADLAGVGLRILERVEKMSPAETAEYAVLLHRSGAVEEALGLLRKQDPKVVPEVLLYTAFCHLSRYEYRSAAGALKPYLELQKDPYKNLVGRMNLAYSLFECGEFGAAESLVNEILQSARANGHSRLVANALELRAQCHIHSKNFVQASADLDEALGIMGKGQSRDQLWIKKWRAVLEGYATGMTDSLEKFRAEAAARRHWPSVRDAELLALKIKFSPDAFAKLFVGTPYADYRRELRESHPAQDVPTEYLFGGDSKNCLDVVTGEILGMAPGLMVTKGNRLVLDILARDLYRPLSVGALFSQVFPGDHFCIFSSPARVHQAIYRCRLWLGENEVPLSISEDHGEFHLERKGEFGLLLKAERTAGGEDIARLKILKNEFGQTGQFKPTEARKVLDLPGTSFNRFTSWAIAEGEIIREGQGPATRYKIAA